MANNPFMSDLPVRHYLREWREKRGLSQEQLGKLCGTTGATISRYEKDERGLPLELLYKFLDVFDIQPGQFFAPPEAPSLDAEARDLDRANRRQLHQIVTEFCATAKRGATDQPLA
jgi:transcriptional regulator with XRE-family HTH domain